MLKPQTLASLNFVQLSSGLLFRFFLLSPLKLEQCILQCVDSTLCFVLLLSSSREETLCVLMHAFIDGKRRLRPLRFTVFIWKYTEERPFSRIERYDPWYALRHRFDFFPALCFDCFCDLFEQALNMRPVVLDGVPNHLLFLNFL